MIQSLNSELGIRPVYHRLERRVDAHILSAFLAGQDVGIPTQDGLWLILPRYTQPPEDLQILLDQIRLDLPAQPPPRMSAQTIPVPA